MEFDSYFFLASIAAVLVGLSKGGLPTIGMLAVPILSLVMSPVKATVLLLPIYIISDLVGIWLYRKNFSAVNLKILVPAGIVGVAIGWATASFTSDIAIKFMVGLVGIGFCLNTWMRKAPEQTQSLNVKKGFFWGSLSGFTSFISHAGGPPFQIYVLPQKLPKLQLAGTSTLFFAVINAAKILPYQQLSPYSESDLTLAALLIPFALLGTVVGAYLTNKIADVWFYRWIQAGLLVISLKLISDAVTGLMV